MTAQRYTQAHLELLNAATGSTWLEVMNSDSRLQTIASVAQPPLNDELGFESGGPFTWADFHSLVVRDFYGLWPNPSDDESEVAEQFRSLAHEWMVNDCYLDTASERAQECVTRAEKLKSAI